MSTPSLFGHAAAAAAILAAVASLLKSLFLSVCCARRSREDPRLGSRGGDSRRSASNRRSVAGPGMHSQQYRRDSTFYSRTSHSSVSMPP